MSNGHPIIPVIVLAAFGTLVYLGGRGGTPSKGTQVPLEATATTWVGTRSHDDKPESTLEIISPNGDSWGLSLYAGGVPYQERSQAERDDAKRTEAEGGKPEPRWSYKWTRHRYPIDFDTDLGGWSGFRVATADAERPDGEVGFDMGLRYSPVRLAYGVISPDILVSPRQAGIGCSFYAPPQSVRYPFPHLGVGLGYLADYRGGNGWTPYLAISTRF